MYAVTIHRHRAVEDLVKEQEAALVDDSTSTFE